LFLFEIQPTIDRCPTKAQQLLNSYSTALLNSSTQQLYSTALLNNSLYSRDCIANIGSFFSSSTLKLNEARETLNHGNGID
jgi:hypothetical protein